MRSRDSSSQSSSRGSSDFDDSLVDERTASDHHEDETDNLNDKSTTDVDQQEHENEGREKDEELRREHVALDPDPLESTEKSSDIPSPVPSKSPISSKRLSMSTRRSSRSSKSFSPKSSRSSEFSSSSSSGSDIEQKTSNVKVSSDNAKHSIAEDSSLSTTRGGSSYSEQLLTHERLDVAKGSDGAVTLKQNTEKEATPISIPFPTKSDDHQSVCSRSRSTSTSSSSQSENENELRDLRESKSDETKSERTFSRASRSRRISSGVVDSKIMNEGSEIADRSSSRDNSRSSSSGGSSSKTEASYKPQAVDGLKGGDEKKRSASSSSSSSSRDQSEERENVVLRQSSDSSGSESDSSSQVSSRSLSRESRLKRPAAVHSKSSRLAYKSPRKLGSSSNSYRVQRQRRPHRSAPARSRGFHAQNLNYFQRELLKIEKEMKQLAKKNQQRLVGRTSSPHTPMIRNSLSPYYNTDILRYVINTPVPAQRGYVTRATASSLVDPEVSWQMDKTMLRSDVLQSRHYCCTLPFCNKPATMQEYCVKFLSKDITTQSFLKTRSSGYSEYYRNQYRTSRSKTAPASQRRHVTTMKFPVLVPKSYENSRSGKRVAQKS